MEKGVEGGTHIWQHGQAWILVKIITLSNMSFHCITSESGALEDEQ